MPVVRCQRTVAAPREAVWELIDEPESLPRWWPTVTRVEDASPSAWTAVLGSPKGKAVRADYSLVERSVPERLRWRHEVDESPFERVLSSSVYELALEQREDGSTDVRLSAELRLRGFARLGGMLVVRATRRQLDEALDGLARTLVPEDGG